MNKDKVQQILQIETQAQKIRSDAEAHAKQLVLDAKAEVQKLRDESESKAQEEADKICDKAFSVKRSDQIHQQSKQKGEEKEQLAKQNFDKAVDFVLMQLIAQD